jgi:hypothetical protein
MKVHIAPPKKQKNKIIIKKKKRKSKRKARTLWNGGGPGRVVGGVCVYILWNL